MIFLRSILGKTDRFMLSPVLLLLVLSLTSMTTTLFDTLETSLRCCRILSTSRRTRARIIVSIVVVVVLVLVSNSLRRMAAVPVFVGIGTIVGGIAIIRTSSSSSRSLLALIFLFGFQLWKDPHLTISRGRLEQ